MKRLSLLPVVLLLVLAPCGYAAETDQDKVQGTWTMVFAASSWS
jgi:hypothetical protein